MGVFESYSINPKRYGGGRIIASFCKEFEDFHIFAADKCFDELSFRGDNKLNCHSISDGQRQSILNGDLLESVVPQIQDFDLIFSQHTQIQINTQKRQAVWSVGYNESVHESHQNLLLYNEFQNPRVNNAHIKCFKFQLGTQLTEFHYQTKENFIFQCTRHAPEFGSIEVADFCNRNDIKVYFAGPIVKDYPLLSYINNKNSFYFGEISESLKRTYTRRAKLYTFIHKWPTPMSLSAVEALSLGTPVVCTNMGFWPSLVKDGFNGFIVSNEEGLLKAWQSADEIKQENCYRSVLKYNHHAMLDSVYNIFERILTDV